MKRRSALLGTALLGLRAALPAGAQTPARVPITVLLTTTADSIPFYYAQQQGMFERAGLDVTATIVTSGSVASAAVIGGSAQIGSSNIFTVMQAHQRGIPLVLIAAAGQHDPSSPNSELFVHRESAVRTAKDLEDKTVAVVSLHDLQTLSTRALIEATGGDSTKVKFLEIPQSAMLEALSQKRVDGIVAYEPFRTADEASGVVRSLGAPFSAISRDMIYTAWIAMAPWVSQNRPIASRFVGVIRQATEYTNAHYFELIPLLAQVTKLPVETLQKSHRIKDAMILNPAWIQPVIDAAAKFKELTSGFPASEIIASGL